MRGLLVKDAIIIRNSLSPFYLFPLLIIALGSRGRVEFLFFAVVFLVPVFCGFFLYNVLYSEENSSWGRLERALPLSVGTVVRAKYVLGLCLMGLSWVINGALSIVFLALGVRMQVLLVSLLVAESFGLLYLSILIPSVLRCGVSSGPIIFVSIIGLFTVAPAALDYLGALSSVLSALSENVAMLAVGTCAASLLIYLLSYVVSLRVRGR